MRNHQPCPIPNPVSPAHCGKIGDDLGAKKVFVRSPDRHGIGLAVYNRLLRAAAFRIVKLDDRKD